MNRPGREARFEAYLDNYAWLLNALTLYLQRNPEMHESGRSTPVIR